MNGSPLAVVVVTLALAPVLGATGSVAAASPHATAVDGGTASVDAVTTDAGAVTARNTTGDATGNATGTVDDTAENTTDTADDTVDNTTDTVDDTTGNTTDTVNDTVDNTTDTVDDTTDTVDNTTDTVDDTAENVTGAVDDAARNVTDAVGNTTGTGGASATTASRTETARNGTASTGDRETGGGDGESGTQGWQGVEGDAVAVGVGATLAVALVRRTSTAAVAGAVPGTGSVRTAAGTGLQRVRDWVGRLLAPLGYSRYDDSDPLEHDTRAALYRRISGTPGQHLSALDAGTEGSFSTVRHHLRVLERENLVTSHRVRGRRRYFPAGTDRPELAAALVDESTGAVLRTLARTGPASVSDLAAELDRDPSTVTHHLQRLADDGLVVRERDGRRVETRLAPDVVAALREHPTGRPSD